MSDDELVSFLAKVDLFDGLSQRVLRKIAAAGRVESFEPNAVVLQEGEEVSGFRSFSQRGVEMHVVLSGSAEVVVDHEAHGSVNPGEYFGELSLIDGLPRSAGISAGPDGLKTFALAKWTFTELLDQHPEISRQILLVMVARLRASESANRRRWN